MYSTGAELTVLSPGTVLGNGSDANRFRIIAHLGSGGFGDAYTALDIPTGGTVGIKTLRADVIAAQPDLESVLSREAEAAMRVTHPNVVSTYAFVSASDSGVGLPYIVMEYVAGGDLAGILAGRAGVPVPNDALLTWFLQLAVGLSAIHTELLHRDLKPENVLVANGQLKISDFGLAKYVEQATRTMTFKGYGTPLYIAPEIWYRQSATEASDIYALGVLFYQAATLHVPFSGGDLQAIQRAHCLGPVPRPSLERTDLDAGLDSIIVKMLQKEPANRYGSAQDVVAALQGLASVDESAPSVLADIVNKARSYQDQQERQQAGNRARQDERQQSLERIEYAENDLLQRLDALVEQINRRMPGHPIEVAESGEMFETRRSYRFHDRVLSVGFFAPPSASEVKAMAGLGGVATGYVYLRPGTEEYTGFHLVLVRRQSDVYGQWWTLNTEDHALSRVPVRYNIVFDQQHEVVEEIGRLNIMHPFVVHPSEFTDEHFLDAIRRLVDG
jgi:eukaryotic-like serine/threonine-protein kinase